MNILITGGVGFIGTNCAIYFAKKKTNRITIVDNFSRHGVEKNANFIKKNYPSVDIIKADIQNIAKFLTTIKKSDLIIHLAGQTAVTKSIADPEMDFNSNLAGSFTLLEAVRKYNRRSTILFASTNKVYGDLSHHNVKLDEKKIRYIDSCHPNGISEDEPLNFISPYGCSKGATDMYFLDYARIFNLKTVVFRQSCIYGPFQIGIEDQGWVAHFSKQLIAEQPLKIFGDGNQVRDLLFIDDLIRLYENAHANIEKISGSAFNVGGGIDNAFSLKEIIDQITKYINTQSKLTYNPTRQGDQKYFVSNNSKINKAIGWEPKTSVSSGLPCLIDWQRQHIFS